MAAVNVVLLVLVCKGRASVDLPEAHRGGARARGAPSGALGARGLALRIGLGERRHRRLAAVRAGRRGHHSLGPEPPLRCGRRPLPRGAPHLGLWRPSQARGRPALGRPVQLLEEPAHVPELPACRQNLGHSTGQLLRVRPAVSLELGPEQEARGQLAAGREPAWAAQGHFEGAQPGVADPPVLVVRPDVPALDAAALLGAEGVLLPALARPGVHQHLVGHAGRLQMSVQALLQASSSLREPSQVVVDVEEFFLRLALDLNGHAHGPWGRRGGEGREGGP
mmetsp:Transcript_48285/g.149120  ORF Transcript_48285/g.149120 Transcript_48285/m.149120 type:complete len:280 (+) Transcript_48285:3-842(+)